MNLCILSFSGRADGNCCRIAGTLQQHRAAQDTVERYDFSALTVTPCGRCRYECFQAREQCPYRGDPEVSLCGAVIRSDLACFIVPNYCDYPCANFFAFNERSQCVFQHRPDLLEQYLAVRKKFIVVSNTGRDNFTAAFRYHIPEGTEPDILFLSARQFQKVSLHGDLMDSPDAQEALFRFLAQ